MEEEKKNYIKEYYSQKEHNLRALVENLNIESEEEIRVIKQEINKLQNKIDLQKTLLQNN